MSLVKVIDLSTVSYQLLKKMKKLVVFSKMNINHHSKNSHNIIDIENNINIYNKNKINNNVKRLVVTSL